MKTNNKMLMNRKTLLIIVLLGLATPSLAFIFEQVPSTILDLIVLDSINITQYGWTGNDSVCSPVHVQIPYNQLYIDTYIKLGYVPICDVNQSDYITDITLFCDGEYVQSWNYTDNCPDADYEFEWITINRENLSASLFQTEELSTIHSCMFCVNDTSTNNRTDFWIRLENAGNNVIVEYHNETVIIGLEMITDTIIDAVELTALIINLASLVLTIIGIVWALFLVPMFVLFMFDKFLKRLRATIKSAKGGK